MSRAQAARTPSIQAQANAKRAQLTRYKLNDDGTVSTIEAPERNGGSRNYTLGYAASPPAIEAYQKAISEPNVFTSLKEAQDTGIRQQGQRITDLRDTYEQQLADPANREGQYNTLADQIAGLTGGVRRGGGTDLNQALTQLSSGRNYGASDLSSRLNFQVSDQQILDDYNSTRLGRLNRIVEDGTAQIAGIQSRLAASEELLAGLPSGDPRRTSAKVSIDQLKSDLASVQGAVTKASDQVNNYKPITPDSEDGLKEITSFREFVKLPEERAGEQLKQIDPESYKTAVGLGQRYRQLATEELPATTTPQTEQLRQTIEQEALNQLRLGSTLGAEERRGYEQAVRAAQTARGNIFGLGPAVQEAAQLGAAGEQRKLARYGAAQQFLASGETTGGALQRDLAFRDALTRERLGAASGFLAGGPSLANLAQQRIGQQQAQFQNYINANVAQPGQFNVQANQVPFYQTANPEIPVQLAGNAASIYNTMQNAQASMYGSQVGAIASTYTSPFQAFGQVASGIGSLGQGFSGLASAGILCWVAREVYGEDNPRWMMFREWMLTKASDNLRNYYIKHGEKIAKSIKNMPKVKRLIRKWMDGKIKEIYGT
jgi:hypothetical protein